jgi:hypothetical protein
MKNFILRIGEPIVTVAVVVGISMSIIMAYSQASALKAIGQTTASTITFLLVSAIGIAGVVIVAFLVYLLIDIRNELKYLNEKLKTTT